ncbi:MAG: hypothetical protein U1F46_12565 [Marinagarivorans sp.]
MNPTNSTVYATQNLFAALPPIPQQLTLAGETLDITPLRVGELPAFSRAITPISNAFSAEPDWMRLMSHNGDDLIEVLAIAARRPAQWVGGLALDEGIALAEAIFEANLDFFIHRVVPMIVGSSTRIVQTLSSLGPTASSSSSAPDTSTPAS